MKLKLYLVSRTDKIGYDEYDSFIIAAESRIEARAVHPDGRNGWNDAYGTWIPITDILSLEVRYLGTAGAKIEWGVVMSSFNAG